MFRITKKAENRTGIIRMVDSLDELGDSVLGSVNISEVVEAIENNEHQYYPDLIFQDTIQSFKNHYQKDEYMNVPTSYMTCKDCEFQTSVEDEAKGLESGFKECFKKQHNWGDVELKKPKIFDVRNLNYRKGIKLFDEGVFFMNELTKESIGYKEESNKLSSTTRQWLQITKELNSDSENFVDNENLKQEIDNWSYPLHFIDFETSSVPLPFNKGRKPYEQIAFQFSHHIYYEDGRIEHASQYINNNAGVFPNFEFIRELKKVLSNDNGTILRYSPHENTILNAIHKQLRESMLPDKKELIEFIENISHSSRKSEIIWEGDRDMVDLLEVLKKYYYNPLTKGSYSIKDVLPAVLGSSQHLQKKYSQLLKDNGVSSKNFIEDHIWLSIDRGEVINPYKMLPPLFNNWTEEEIEKTLSEIESIAEGGAALTAYGKLQYTDMSKAEVEELTSALLKYCELDTLAMVMIYEHLNELINN